MIMDQNQATDQQVRTSKMDDEFEYGVLGLVKKLRKETNNDQSGPLELLTQAVDYFLSNPSRGSKDITINEVRVEFESRDNFEKTSHQHRKTWKADLDKFCDAFGA